MRTRTKEQFVKRLLSIFLCVALLPTCLPITAFAAESSTDSYYNKIVDANTMDLWKNYFDLRDGYLNTANAGGVWTDKSVFSDASAFSGSVQMVDDEKNFLTALSAIAANKEVVGYSTVPTDTVFILDLSNSMSASDVSDLVDATNAAIRDLLKINNNNRIGVVLYSGTSANRTYNNSVASLMPIDRYTTTNADGNFIEYNNGTVRLVTNRNGTLQVSGTGDSIKSESKSHGGATYIQAGLWEAYKMFDAVPDEEIQIGENNWQSGDYRMPIVVLMSDGAPTLGASKFADVENTSYTVTTGNGRNQKVETVIASDVGNGNDDNLPVGQGFLVQLTASYIKNRIENKYKVHEQDGAGRSLFYTLGFNLSYDNDNDIEPADIAYNVLNPDATTLTDSLWATYNSLTATNNTMEVRVKGRNNNSFIDVSVTKNSYATSKSYVDEFFAASGDGLSAAFDDIVDEIILQSRYYPTHLEGGSPDFSGYVEFTDTLGDYMEVKHINGILLGDTLFDGHMMASKLADTSTGGLGTPDAPTDLGNEFIWSVKSRLGIESTADAQILVANAYESEQLCYITDEDGNLVKWSNYIGWYADAAGKYLGHWDESENQSVPTGAVYKIKSYGFLGETSGSIKNSDMMYMSVQVKTDIATGVQTVSWKIPASLVPMITYLVEVDGTNIDNAENVRLSVEDKNVAPIRLVYETGLRSDLNEFNITRITDQEHIAEDGQTRIFWNNYFDISAPTHDEHVTAKSEFTPNKENERFYYVFDSAVHKKADTESGYAIVSEDEGLDPKGEYYHRRYVFQSGKSDPVFFYEKMSELSIQAAIDNGWQADFESLKNETVGAWVVPKGTPARELNMYDMQKSTNPTNSAGMVFHPYLTEQNNIFYVDMNLGNNGLLSVTPATGIKISKTVDIFETGTSDTFKFRITASESGSFDSWITDLDVTPSGEATTATLTNGVCEFEMKKDQTFWLTGLSAGTVYTVEEISSNDDYKIKSVHVNGVPTGQIAAGTVTQYLIDDVDFVNTAVGEGDLVITKQVVDANGNTVDVNDNIEFTIDVTLTNSAGAPVSGTFEATGGTLTVPADGKFTVKLSDGESFVVRGIPEETNYTVVETNIPAGFRFNADASSMTGVVDATANDQALVVNTYIPVGTNGNGANVEVTKTISGNRTTWRDGESYTFNLERLEVLRAVGTVIATDTISYSETEKKVSFSLASEVYSTAGTYYYRITEKVGSQGGITYDTAERRFSVVVADSDMDGDLEITAVNNELNTAVSGRWTVTADFNNIYAPTGSATATINIQKAVNDGYSLAGFQFALYDANPFDENTQANEILRSNVTGADGKAAVTLTYAANRATMEGAVYTYYLAEIVGDNPNITYTKDVYTVNVTVKDNGDGTISAVAAVEGVNGNTVPFENVYTPSTSDFVTITGKKTISTNNRVLNAGEFSFKIEGVGNAPMPDVTTVKNAADGSFAFGAIEFNAVANYQYYITEVDTDKIGGFAYDTEKYTVDVSVIDNGNATLTANVSVTKSDGTPSDIVFENEYAATPATVSFAGTKILTGKTMLSDEFGFEFKAVTTGAPMPSNGSVVSNTANGTVDFGTITFDKAGIFVYTVTEANGGNKNYDYDESVYTITVVVTDNSEGKLSATYTMTKDNMPSNEIVFRNGFTPDPIKYDIDTAFGGEKVLDGRPLAEEEFEFKLINAISGVQIGETVKNDANGSFAFPAVTLPEAGDYHFKITEVGGDEKGISYDNSSYHIILKVEQNDTGILSVTEERLYKGTVTAEEVGGVLTEVTNYENITENGKIAFHNIYKADPAFVALAATKVLTGRELVDGEFKFDLHQTEADFIIGDKTLKQDDVVLTLKDNGSGHVAFMPMVFDTEGTYYYVIVEDETNEKGITVDKTMHKVVITVTDNHNGDLTATLKVNGKDIVGSTADTVIFNNTYKAAATEIVIQGIKILDGRDLVAGEFSFELYDQDGTKLQTVKNAADGTFAFAAIPVEAEGKYVYTVKEVQGDGEGITYDAAIYTVTATVKDNLDGTFKVEYSYVKGTEAADGVTFLNIYTKPTPAPEPEDPEIPKTADNTNLVLWIALPLVSSGCLLGTVVCKKKHEAEGN